MTLLETLYADLQESLNWNQNSEVEPACLLWPDEDRLFESAFTLLAANEARFYCLGEWDEASRRGPSYWLRWKLDGGQMAGEKPPIWYLPGVSRAGLRPEESVAEVDKPLCELLYRGRAFSHENGKDQTPLAWLLSHDVAISGDAATREALARTLPSLWSLSIDSLRGRGTLRASDFDEILNPEPIENLLSWMNDATAFEKKCDPAQWKSFLSMVKARWRIQPAKDGPLGAAEKLAGGSPEWEPVWKSFERGVTRFSGVVSLLEKLRPPVPKGQKSLFESVDKLRYPSECAANELVLRPSLEALHGQSSGDAREQVGELEKLGGLWRDSLWAKIGRAPLAYALEKLVELGARTVQLPTGTTPQEMAQNWTLEGWKTDALVWEILALGKTEPDFAALKSATRALYGGWLDEAATLFAVRVKAAGATLPQPVPTATSPGSVHLFVDGLRFDLAQKLLEKLDSRGIPAQLDWRFGPLPGVTPTAKPAVAPLDWSRFTGGDKLNAAWADGHKVNAENLRTELQKEGFSILSGLQTGDPKTSEKAWLESGNFDSLGHQSGAGLALHLETELENLATRIELLLKAGWSEVKVVTDHGWLLLPGAMAKAQLPEHLTEIRKGRCARLKPGQSSEFMSVRWHWDENVEIAVAPGARCFEEGKEYEHGGLSLQECVLPVLHVSSGGAQVAAGRILETKWAGLRLRVRTEGGLRLDLRRYLNDAESSFCGGARIVAADGSTSLIIADDSLQGSAAHLVLLNAEGEILDKRMESVGG